MLSISDEVSRETEKRVKLNRAQSREFEQQRLERARRALALLPRVEEALAMYSTEEEVVQYNYQDERLTGDNYRLWGHGADYDGRRVVVVYGSGASGYSRYQVDVRCAFAGDSSCVSIPSGRFPVRTLSLAEFAKAGEVCVDVVDGDGCSSRVTVHADHVFEATIENIVQSISHARADKKR